MGIKGKALLVFSALAACATLAFAQGSTQAPPPPPQQGQEQGQGGRRQGGPPLGGQMGGRGMMGHPMDGEMQEGMRGQMMAGPMHMQMMRRHVRGAIRRRMIMCRHLRRGGMGFGHGPMGHMGMQPGMGRGIGRGMGMGMGMGGGRGPAPLGRIVNNPAMRERLGITAEQAAKITQQENDFQKAGIQNRATMEIKHMELEQLMSSEKPDRAAIDKKLSEISAAQLTEQQANVHHQLDMKSAMTPEQQMKLHQWMESQQPGMSPEGPQGMGRGGRGPGRPQPPPPPARQPGGEPGSPGGAMN